VGEAGVVLVGFLKNDSTASTQTIQKTQSPIAIAIRSKQSLGWSFMLKVGV